MERDYNGASPRAYRGNAQQMQNASKNRWASYSLRQMVIRYRTVVIIRSTRLSCLRSEFLHPLVPPPVGDIIHGALHQFLKNDR